MEGHSHIKLVSDCFIRPKFKIQQSNIQPHCLAREDLIMLSMHYMQKGLLFAKPPIFTINDLTSLLNKLKSGLSQALIYFYPLAGRLATKRYEDEHFCSIYIDCNKGPGARFIHATIDVTLSHILSSCPDAIPTIRSFFDLGEKYVVNHDGHTRALLTVQVTDLLDGVFIGFTMNHAVADGTTLWHFIKSLSEIFNSECEEHVIPMISHVPVYSPLGQVIKLPYLDSGEFITRLDLSLETRERIFHFSGASMEMLKAKTNRECTGWTYEISSFQSLSSLLWRSITRARKLPLDATVTCALVVNSRSRLNPPLSPVHFGNFRLMAVGTTKVGELLENGLGWAAKKLNRAIAAQNDEANQRNSNKYAKAPFVAQPNWANSFFGPNSIVIGGSTRFDMYGPEFGLGRAVGVQSGYGNKDDGTVTANPGREGGGSVDLEVCLLGETMNALEFDEEFVSFVS